MWDGFITYGFVEGLAPRIIGLLFLIALVLLAGASLRFHAWSDILPYSLAWTFMMAILDGVFSVPYAGWELYLDWNLWFGYAVVAIAPLFAPYLRLERFSLRPPRHLS